MDRRRSSTWAVLLLLSDCAGTMVPRTRAPAQELAPLAADARPVAASGYVAGTLTAAEDARGFGFVLVDAAGRELVVPFDDVHPRHGLRRGQPALYALPPGAYEVEAWTSARLGKVDMPRGHVLTSPFVVGDGRIVFLGAFVASQSQKIGAPQPEGIPIGTELGIQPEEISADEARARLAAAYPGFAAVALQCLTCVPSFRD